MLLMLFVISVNLYLTRGHYISEYGKGGIHENPKGFFVLSGEGMAKIGEEEFAIHEGMSFLAPAGVHHVVKSSSADVPVKVFWFHSAV